MCVCDPLKKPQFTLYVTLYLILPYSRHKKVQKITIKENCLYIYIYRTCYSSRTARKNNSVIEKKVISIFHVQFIQIATELLPHPLVRSNLQLMPFTSCTH